MRHTRKHQNKRKKGRNVPMDKWRDTLGRVGILDLSFKWHREYNNVSYGNGDNQVFIDIYRDSVYW